MNLNTDQLDIEATPDGIVVEPSYVGFLRSQGYNIEDVSDVHVVPSGSRDVAHVVMRVTTTDKPPGHPESDVVADKTEIAVCSCEAFQYTESVDVSKKTLADGSIGRCKHIIDCYKTERAKADEKQHTLL